MNNKTITIYSYGFPVKLINPPTKNKLGVRLINIGNKELDALVIRALITKRGKLTGDEVRFIRNKIGLTLAQFGKKFGNNSHQAVMKWERCASAPTTMNDATEQIIRLALASDLLPNNEFKNKWIQIVDENLLSQKPQKTLTIQVRPA